MSLIIFISVTVLCAVFMLCLSKDFYILDLCFVCHGLFCPYYFLAVALIMMEIVFAILI